MGKDGKNTPGPGHHSPDKSKVLNTAPQFGFGSEFRGTDGKGDLGPGPGGYQLKGLIGNEGIMNTMHGTLDYTPEKKENNSKPGPGAYDDRFKVVKKTNPGWKLGTAVRNDMDSKKRALF